jgi:hypothetical protein
MVESIEMEGASVSRGDCVEALRPLRGRLKEVLEQARDGQVRWNGTYGLMLDSSFGGNAVSWQRVNECVYCLLEQTGIVTRKGRGTVVNVEVLKSVLEQLRTKPRGKR